MQITSRMRYALPTKAASSGQGVSGAAAEDDERRVLSDPRGVLSGGSAGAAACCCSRRMPTREANVASEAAATPSVMTMEPASRSAIIGRARGDADSQDFFRPVHVNANPDPFTSS